MSICIKHASPRSPENRIPCLSSFETPFVKYGTPVKEITSVAGFFSIHIILRHYDILGLQIN